MNPKLTSIIQNIRKQKTFIKKQDLALLLDLPDHEKEYIAERLSKTHKDLILKCMDTVEEVNIDDDIIIPLSRKTSYAQSPELSSTMSPDISKISPLISRNKPLFMMNKDPSNFPQIKLPSAALSTPEEENKESFKVPLPQTKKFEDMWDSYDGMDYPFLKHIKKMMFAFGDLNTPHLDTAKVLHDFLYKWFRCLCSVKIENLTKATLQEIFPEECGRYIRNKKIHASLKRSIKDFGDDNSNSDEDIEFFENATHGKKQLSSLPKIDDDLLLKISSIPNELEKPVSEENEIHVSSFTDSPVSSFQVNELAVFNDKRTKLMEAEEYIFFGQCRVASLLGKGKQPFLNWIGKSVLKEIPKSLLELVVFLGKETLRKLIEEIIRERNDGILEVLDSPITTSEITPRLNSKIEFLKQRISKLKNQNGDEKDFLIFYKDFLKNPTSPQKRKRRPKVNVGVKGESITINIPKTLLLLNQEYTPVDPTAKIKKMWDSLNLREKEWYSLRRHTEEELRKYFKRKRSSIYSNEDFIPSNGYGKFIKDRLISQNIRKCNADVLRLLFQTWMSLSLSEKNKYLENKEKQENIEEMQD